MNNWTLRNFRDSDFEAFHESMSVFDVVKMTGSWPWPPNPEFTRARMFTPQAKAGQVSVIDVAGLYAGQVSVVAGELGYMIGKPFWGRGMTTWAVTQKLADVFGSTDIDVIVARVWAGNPASEAILAKHKFTKTEESIDFCKPRDEMLLGYSFELKRSDWLEEWG